MPEHITAGMKEIARGIARYNKGCYKDSLEYFFGAHELFVASDQLSGVAMSLNNIGNVYRITKTALKADRLSGFNKSIADDLAAIGSARLRPKKNELAVNFLKRSVEIYALIGDDEKVHNVMKKLEKVSGKVVQWNGGTLNPAI